MITEKLLFFYIVGVLIFLVQCVDDPAGIAGGTGAGNPSGTISMVILANEKELTLGKTPPETVKVYKNPIMNIVDSDGSAMVIKKSEINMKSIGFIVKNPEDIVELSKKSDSRWRIDKNAVIIDGPFLVDLLNGSSVPSLDSITVPEADYSGIHIELFNDNVNDAVKIECVISSDAIYVDYSIQIKNNIEYDYNLTDHVGTVGQNEKLEMALLLSASEWLDSINLTKDIGKKNFPLTNNVRVLASDSDDPLLRNLARKLEKNIMKSGNLSKGKVVKNVKASD